MRIVTDLGIIGTTGGILQPIDLPLDKDGAAWNLTGYDLPEIRVRNWRTKEDVTLDGTVTIDDPAAGIVRYAPADPDILTTLPAAVYEARVYVRPDPTKDHEPSGRFTFEIEDSP